MIDTVLPGYKKLSEAPNFAQLEELATNANLELEAVMKEEAEVRYKSVKNPGTKYEVYYLMQNPAVVKLTTDDGIALVTRFKPLRIDVNTPKYTKAPKDDIFE